MLLSSILLSVVLAAQAAPPPQQTIVGGEEVQPPGKYPWQGYLLRGIGGFTCGCVLVDTDVVLTAAHCVDGANPSSLTVGFGAHDRETGLEGAPEEYSVETIAVHPNWTNSGNLGFPYDLAVMSISPANVDSVFIGPIPIPEAGRTPEDWVDLSCAISGWGRPSGAGQLPNLLQEAPIPVITESLCQSMWTPEQVGDYHVCVWDETNQDTGACNGDSGGPLVCQDDSGVYELVGITSWGISGCSPTYPSVYARVSFFREWIDDVLTQWSLLKQ